MEIHYRNLLEDELLPDYFDLSFNYEHHKTVLTFSARTVL